MIYVRLIDKNGMFISDEFVEELTEFTIETPCPSGFYHPKWDFENEEWVEGLTDEEIEERKGTNEPHIPTTEERLEVVEEMLMYTMMNTMNGGM